MTRLPGALCGACACMLLGVMRYMRLKDTWEQLNSFLHALKKLDAGLQFSSCPLPELIKSSAPGREHYLYKLGETMEQSGPISMKDICKKAGMPPLSPTMQQVLLQWLESLLLPDPGFRQKAMENTLTLWENETEKAGERLMRRGTLAIRLSLTGGCALFIILC